VRDFSALVAAVRAVHVAIIRPRPARLTSSDVAELADLIVRLHREYAEIDATCELSAAGVRLPASKQSHDYFVPLIRPVRQEWNRLPPRTVAPLHYALCYGFSFGPVEEALSVPLLYLRAYVVPVDVPYAFEWSSSSPFYILSSLIQVALCIAFVLRDRRRARRHRNASSTALNAIRRNAPQRVMPVYQNIHAVSDESADSISAPAQAHVCSLVARAGIHHVRSFHRNRGVSLHRNIQSCRRAEFHNDRGRVIAPARAKAARSVA